jgi:hypothetical protein
MFETVLLISVLIAGSLLAWLYIERRRLSLAIRRGNTLAWPESRLKERVISKRQRLVERWDACQSKFAVDPIGAVDEADRLAEELMQDPSYARVVNSSMTQGMHYREATDIMDQHRLGEASIDDLRVAFIHYRAVLDAMLETRIGALKRAS